MICKSCGKYTDQYEWPDHDKQNYVPDLCYHCYLDLKDNLASKEDVEDPEDTENSLEEVSEVDDEIDDAPYITDQDREDAEDHETKSTQETTSHLPGSQELAKFLFG